MEKRLPQYQADLIAFFSSHEIIDWFVAAVFTGIACIITASVMPIGYEGVGDDQFLAGYLAGYFTGMPETKIPFLNQIYTYILAGLYMVFPGVHWYPVVLIALFYFSCTTVVRCIIFTVRQRNISVLVAFPLGLAYYCFICYDFIWFSFSSVPCVICAAVAALLLCIDYEMPSWKGYTALCAVLIFLAYIIRSESTIVGICFCAAAIFYRFMIALKEKQLKVIFPKLAIFLVIVAFLIGVASACTYFYENAPQNQSYYSFRHACAGYFDRPHEYAYMHHNELGVSDAFFNILDRWFFLDPFANTYLLNMLSGADLNNPDSLFVFHQSVNEALNMGFNQITSKEGHALIISCFFLFVLCIILAIIDWKRNWQGFLTVLLTCAGSIFLCFYSCMIGRFPIRVLRLIAIPCFSVSLVICLIMISNNTCYLKRFFSSVLIVIAVVTCCNNLGDICINKDQILRKQRVMDWGQAMDEIATSNPDKVYFFGTDLVSIGVAFPEYDNGLPSNLFYWGGSYFGTIPHSKQMKINKMDEFDAEIFLSGRGLLMTAVKSDSKDLLHNYLQWRFGDVDCELLETKVNGEIGVYRFYLKNTEMEE